MFDRLFIGQEDDKSLVEKAKNSHHDFARLYDRFADVVYRFVRWKVATDQDAEDIVSETFMAIAQKIKEYDTSRDQKVSTWILAIAQYKFLDHMRLVYKERENMIPIDDYFDPGYEDDFATILTNKDIYESIITVVKTLPERQSSVFFLRYIE
jgi:RNA polymerase sigma-70 factor, ECF subfamily